MGGWAGGGEGGWAGGRMEGRAGRLSGGYLAEWVVWSGGEGRRVFLVKKGVEGEGNEGILIVRIMVCAEGTSVQVGGGREGEGGREEGRVDRGKGRE